MGRFGEITAWLGGLPVWKFVGLLLLAVLLLPIGVVVLLPSSWQGDDPELIVRVFDMIAVCVVVPLAETFLFQFLIVWLMNRWVTKNILLQVVTSAVIFGAQHYYHAAYMVYAFIAGIILAWGFCAYYYRCGFRRAFWAVVLVHALRNLLAFVAVYFEN